MTKFKAKYNGKEEIIFADSIYEAQKIMCKKHKISIKNLYKLSLQSEESIINQDFRFL